jgi:hypothetical protein
MFPAVEPDQECRGLGLGFVICTVPQIHPGDMRFDWEP